MELQTWIVLIIELIGTVAFSVSGAMVGMRKQMDIFGVIVLGVVTAVGGGMMRDVFLGRYSVAVRKPDGDIEVDIRQYKSIIPWKTPLKIPFIRGIFNFVDSLVLGMKTLTFSASFFEEEEEEILTEAEAKKREKNEKIMVNLTVVLSVIIAAGLFMVLPYYLSGLRKTDKWSIRKKFLGWPGTVCGTQ